MGSQPSLEERDQAFLMNAAIAPEELYTVSPQIVEPSSFRTRYDLVGNEARASQASSYSTRYGLVDNEARTPQAPSRSTRYGLIDNEAHTSQALPSFQYSTSVSDAQHHASPFGLQYEASAGHSGYSLGMSLEQLGDSLADDYWNPTESINSQPDTALRYG